MWAVGLAWHDLHRRTSSVNCDVNVNDLKSQAIPLKNCVAFPLQWSVGWWCSWKHCPFPSIIPNVQIRLWGRTTFAGFWNPDIRVYQWLLRNYTSSSGHESWGSVCCVGYGEFLLGMERRLLSNPRYIHCLR